MRFAASLESLEELTGTSRCFLYLVNYARMKPEIALKALPILLAVRTSLEMQAFHALTDTSRE